MSELKYPVSIRPLAYSEGGGYLAEFPDLPGCMADGETVEEALHAAEDALQAWLTTANEFGDVIPEPSIARNYSGQWLLRLPKSLHAALALRAKIVDSGEANPKSCFFKGRMDIRSCIKLSFYYDFLLLAKAHNSIIGKGINFSRMPKAAFCYALVILKRSETCK